LTLGALTVNASTLDNASGTLSGNGSLLVNASNVGNSSGTMKAAVDARLYASAQIDNASGNISAGRDLTLSAGQLVNPGTVSAGRDTSISLQGDFTNSAAGIRANRNLAVATTGNFVNTASLQAANDLTINAANIVNDNADQSSSLMAGGKLSTQSATLYNSSSIIGAQVTLAASQSITNAGPKALIGATDVNGKLELLAPYIYNRDDTTSTDTAPQTGILGLGAVVLAGSKDAGGNYTAAAQVLNQSASIESGKDLTVVANVLTNTRRILTVGAGYTDTGSFTGSGVWSLTTTSVPGGRYIEPAHGGSMNADYVNTSYTTTTARNAVEQISPEARLLAGADFTPGVALLQNYWSKVSAAGNISLNGVTLDQDSWRGAASPSERSTSSGTYNYRIYTGARYSLAWGPEVLYAAVPGYESSFTAGGALGGSGNTIINGAGGAGLPGIYAQAAAGNVAGLLTLPAGNLYTSNSAGSTAFLVQTNPAFAATRPWQGSDFYLRQLGLDPGTAPRRLGDNFYEQELVKSQMLALTGKAVTDNYAGAQAQFEQMFARGAANARALGLAGIQPGISLTPAQVAALTGDVIMLEEREVDVPVNGTTTKQKVLVPIVYLASVKPGDLQASGVLISAANIKLAATQGFNNAGTIQSRGNLSIAMTQNAILNNRGGTLKAGQLNIDFGKNLILATAAQDRASVGPLGTRVQTDLGRIASIEVIGNAAIKTAKNFEQTGAQLKAGGDLTADIGGSYILGAVQRTDSLDAAFALKGASGTSSSKLIQNTLSGVQVGGATLIKTGHDFTSQGAGIDSQGGGQISAGGNITLAAVKDSLTTQSQS
jgi:filamentous hemagglutinin